MPTRSMPHRPRPTSSGVRQLHAPFPTGFARWLGCAATLVVAGCDPDRTPAAPTPLPNTADEGAPTASTALRPDPEYPTIMLPAGYRIAKVADGLNFPTSVTWDDQGRLYVVESGSGLIPAQLAPARIMRVGPDGRTTAAVDLTGKGVVAAVVGITWYRGAFYITHRAAEDRTDAISRVTLDGTVTRLLSGNINGQAEHQINDIRVGPDGRMYVAVGLAGNAGVVSNELAGFIRMSPGAHSVPCQDIVLTGQNFQTPDFRSANTADSVLTGAFSPYGTPTRPGQVIPGTTKCGGAIMSFDPGNAEATLRVHAWGFRNVIGLAWDRASGAMYAATNGYDIRGSRPVKDEFDGTYRVQEGAWYGVPDYSAAFDPLTDPRFEPPDQTQAPVFVNGEPLGRVLGFVIDHQASGLTVASKSLIAALTPVNGSPSMIDSPPESWTDERGHLFETDFGDLAPATNPLRTNHSGFRVARVDPVTRQATDFVRNVQLGPASEQGARGQGLERPFDVEFGPDGAMYITDYGEIEVDVSRVPRGLPPYVQMPNTGAIWKVTRVAADNNAPPEIVNLRGFPEGMAAYPLNGTSCYGREQVCIKYTIRDADAGDTPFKTTVEWGDGTPAFAPNAIPANDVPLLAFHKYARAGTYTVTVTATDRRGASRTGTTNLTIAP